MAGENPKRLRKLYDIGCIVCRLQFNGLYTPPEMHHIHVDQNGHGIGMAKRNHDDMAIPLCPIHHRYGDGSASTTDNTKGPQYGIEKCPAQFVEKYGTELELLEMVNYILEKSD